ncbi:Hypothetical predicted protein [Paramuricea clavata]|uniref:Uncharacterized protein n=1 Tax=Paramuricea clavata TaxID=317549 RepID=A0A6S7FYX6_PARCT|nr:Hypothetical predicted protein [Paramuricea clavata]
MFLVLSDSASVDVQVISFFNDLEALYVLFSKTQRIHDLFEAVQLEENLKVLSLKRLNTVRWHSRELCLKVLLSRYDCILSVLETVALDSLIDGNPRKTSIGLLKQIQTKQFLATAYLFREIFASAGPLSRYLQRVHVDFGKALGMVESAIDELNELCKEPELIIRYVEQKHDSPSVIWQQPRIRRRRRMDDENAEGEPAETPEDHWKPYTTVNSYIGKLQAIFANAGCQGDWNRAFLLGNPASVDLTSCRSPHTADYYLQLAYVIRAGAPAELLASCPSTAQETQ